MGCELCLQPGGVLVHQAAAWRVIRAEDTLFPAFYRVVAREHVAEWSDLDEAASLLLVLAGENLQEVGRLSRELRVISAIRWSLGL